MRGKMSAIMVLVVVTGCSIPIADTPTVAIPPNRDNGAVVAALRQINPCALIDPAIASRVGIGAQPVVYANAPHSCTISSTTLSGADDVSFRLGSRVDHFIKWSSAPITLAGAKAYLLDESLERNYCAVFIPVSFEWAIQISTKGRSDGSAIDVCAASTTFAEAAAVKLADPDSLRTDHRILPLSQWDGCSLLATALGEAAGRYTMTLDKGIFGLDGCDASTGPDRELSVKISYSWDPADGLGANRKLVAGQTVDVAEPTRSGSDSSGCRVRWSNGPASTVKHFSDRSSK